MNSAGMARLASNARVEPFGQLNEMSSYDLNLDHETDFFSQELKLELYLHRHYSSEELLTIFTENDGKNARPMRRLAIAKLLFGLDKTIEDAEARIRQLRVGLTLRGSLEILERS